ncbi:MAG TPA: RES domain-containing protein [Longimicrobium sp.]|nr:RES domain-containing protein [Longimicrobium sp.]
MGFRHADSRFPPLWESAAQPAARWHAAHQGPVHYFADTPDGAWAEFIRHEEITDPADLATVERAVWAMEIPDAGYADVQLARAVVTGGEDTYAACQGEADRLSAAGAKAIQAPSAALKRGGAAGWRVDSGLQPGPARDGWVYVLLGPRPDLIGWRTAVGRPSADLLPHVRHFTDPPDP